MFIVFGACLMALAVVGPAAADGTIYWEGQGSDNLPCQYGGFWVVQAPGAITVTAWVNGISYPMSQPGGGNSAWQVASDDPLPIGTTAYATYTGDVTGNTGMELSHCVDLPTPTPTVPVPTDTPTTPPSPTPTSTNTSVPTPTNTSTPGPSPTATKTSMPTDTNTPGPSPTITKTVVPTGTNTPGMTPTVVTNTPGPSPTPTGTPSEKNTAGGTVTGGFGMKFFIGLLGVSLITLGIFFPKAKAKIFVKK